MRCLRFLTFLERLGGVWFEALGRIRGRMVYEIRQGRSTKYEVISGNIEMTIKTTAIETTEVILFSRPCPRRYTSKTCRRHHSINVIMHQTKPVMNVTNKVKKFALEVLCVVVRYRMLNVC